jgi:hypothetical protein
MRGSPPIQAALVLVGLLLLLIPLRSLTSHREVTPAVAVASVHPKPVHLVVRTTAVPCRFQITYLGKILWAEDAASSEVAKDFDIEFPKEGIDLVVDVSWATPALAAIEISVSLADDGAIHKTLWGQGKASDVLTFKEEN